MEKQWEVGKTHKLVDVIGFRSDEDSGASNKEIADILRRFDYIFTVETLDNYGNVVATDNLSSIALNLYFLFGNRDLSRVEIINSVPPKDPVVEWLDKLHYVFSNDNSMGRIGVGTTRIFITTDYGDISGTQQVVEFINNRYELLQKEAKTIKQKELAEKKAKLLEELKEIDKEMDGL